MHFADIANLAAAWARAAPSSVVVLVSVVSITACGEGNRPAPSADVTMEARDGSTLDASPLAEDVAHGLTPVASTPVAPRCALTALVARQVVSPESAVQLGAYQQQVDSGRPMPNHTITFEIVEAKFASGRLSSNRVRTSDEGLGAVRLSVGATPGTIVVRVSSSCSASIDLQIDVTA